MSIFPRILLLAALPIVVGATDAPAEIITPESMRAHVEFLASDALEGRETGTPATNASESALPSKGVSMARRTCSCS